MDRHDAICGGSNPEAAADLPADDAGSDEQLRPTAQHPTLLHVAATAGSKPGGYRADLLSSLGAVDATCSTTAAGLPGDVPTMATAGQGPATGLPAGGSAVSGRLHGSLESPK
jgi:PAB1-binding protein PBP1